MVDRRRLRAATAGLATLFVVAACSRAWAQGGVAGPDQWSDGAVALKLLRALASLAVVIALILLSYYALKRFSWPPVSGLSEGPMRLVQVLSVEPGRRLCLVQVANRAFLLAWTSETATVVAEIDPAEIDCMQPPSPEDGGDARDV